MGLQFSYTDQNSVVHQTAYVKIISAHEHYQLSGDLLVCLTAHIFHDLAARNTESHPLRILRYDLPVIAEKTRTDLYSLLKDQLVADKYASTLESIQSIDPDA